MVFVEPRLESSCLDRTSILRAPCLCMSLLLIPSHPPIFSYSGANQPTSACATTILKATREYHPLPDYMIDRDHDDKGACKCVTRQQRRVQGMIISRKACSEPKRNMCPMFVQPKVSPNPRIRRLVTPSARDQSSRVFRPSTVRTFEVWVSI